MGSARQNLFRLFMWAQLFSVTRWYFLGLLGEQYTPLFTILGSGSPFLLPIVAYSYQAETNRNWLRQSGQQYVLFLFALSIVLSIYGYLILGYGLFAVVHDFNAYFVLLMLIILGANPLFWAESFQVFLRFTVAAVVINLLGLAEFGTLINQYGVGSRSGIYTISYQTYAALGFWPLLLFVSRYRNKTVSVILLISLFAIAQQVLFQKRIGTVKCLIYFVILGVFLSNSARATRLRNSVSSSKIKLRLAAAFSMMVVLACLLAPDVVFAQVESIMDRYTQGKGGRLSEVDGLLADYEGAEYLVGKGFGGYFSMRGGEIFGHKVLRDLRVKGGRTLHVGCLMPFFKGGLLMAAIYYTGIFTILSNRKTLSKDPLSNICFWIVCTMTVFSLQEGMHQMGNSTDLTLLGMSMGRCMASVDAKRHPVNRWIVAK